MSEQIVIPKSVQSRGRILLFSYAFPPMQTQMTPVVTKTMALLSRNGYKVDVLCAAPFSHHLARDESLLPYVDRYFDKVIRLQPPNNFMGKIRLRSRVLSTIPDLMSIMQHVAFETLMEMNLDQYDVIMTWSPFHSINPVMAKLKKSRKDVRWIAQFSDPWARNPLEKRKIVKLWNEWQEPPVVASADFIVHSSSYSRELMMRRQTQEVRIKSAVCPHPFDEMLYPQRPKARNERITLRSIGTLFGRRTPEPLFQALNKLLESRPDLRDNLYVELVGYIESSMLRTQSALSLPSDMITHIPPISYMESLEKMYDADILILIEADIGKNLFVPSKLSDYIGTGVPIIGMVPPGSSEDILKALGGWCASPGDIEGIVRAVQGAVDYVRGGMKGSWYDEEYSKTFSGQRVVGSYIKILKGIKSG